MQRSKLCILTKNSKGAKLSLSPLKAKNNSLAAPLAPTHMKTQEFNSFKESMDAWVKQIRGEFSEFAEVPAMVEENTDNIQHNYELIYELKDEIDELKQEINALKLIQIISLKNKSADESLQDLQKETSLRS